MIKEKRVSKYLLYAIGEIVLVVIGILIALQINNWNENQKSKKDEHYVLNEVLKNLEEDTLLVDAIITQRQKAKNSIIALEKFSDTQIWNTDSVQFHLVPLLTFERYFPINNAYEILKSKGLQLADNNLTTKISRYYDYEQPKIGRSILDIEVAILNIYNGEQSIIRFLSLLNKDKRILIKNPDDPLFKEELSSFLLAFQDNNAGTLDKLLVFRNTNKELREQITIALKKLN